MTWRIGQGWAGAAWLAATMWLGSMVSAAHAQVGHLAAYEVRLDPSSSHQGLASVVGAWTIELRDQCEGWASEDRLHLTTAFTEGGQSIYRRWLTQFEARDGGTLTFDARENIDGVEESHIRGVATATPDGGTRIRLSLPEPRELDLPSGLVFPTRFLTDLLERARSATDAGDGMLVHTATVFEGATDLAAVEISVVVGEHLPAPEVAEHPSAGH